MAERSGLLVGLTAQLDQLSTRDREAILDMLFEPSAPWTLVIATNDPRTLERCDQVLELSTPTDPTSENLEDPQPLSA